jgi:hypothetical protein
MIIGALMGRSYERNIWQQRLLERTGLLHGEPKRLSDAITELRGAGNADATQVNDALDAIAVEVERIGEGQRFLTKLLAEREEWARANRTPSPLPGTVVRAPS